MGKRSWFRSAWEIVGSLWSGIGALVSGLSIAAAIYQAGVNEWGWPGIPFGFDAEPWHFFLVGYAALVVTAISAYHKLNLRTEGLERRLDKNWRDEQRKFEKKYQKYRDEKTEIFSTLELLIKGNDSGDLWAVWTNMNAEDYWPSDQFYLEAFHLISNGETRFESQANFNAFKKRLRRVQGFLGYVQSLPEEFPEAESFLVERNVASHQYSSLHVLWYLWHALGDVTHGYQKEERFVPLPRWHRLWVDWNRSRDVPDDPKLLLKSEDLSVIQRVIPNRPGYSTPSTPDT